MNFEIGYTGINLDKILLIIHDLCVTDSIVTINSINPTVFGTHVVIGVYRFNEWYYKNLIKELQEFNKADEDIYINPSNYTAKRIKIMRSDEKDWPY